MELYTRIKKRREELGLSQEELAKKMGYTSRSTIAKIESGTNDIPQSKIKAFANALATTTSYLMGWDDALGDTDFVGIAKYGIFPIEKKKIPLLGEIACGEPIFANEAWESYIVAGTNIQADYCLKAKGDSMINARIYDGDIVFIRKQSTVENGEIAAVAIDNEVTLKRVYYYPDTNEISLNPENPRYCSIRKNGVELDDVNILGKAVAFQSDVL